FTIVCLSEELLDTVNQFLFSDLAVLVFVDPFPNRFGRHGRGIKTAPARTTPKATATASAAGRLGLQELASRFAFVLIEVSVRVLIKLPEDLLLLPTKPWWSAAETARSTTKA